MKIDLAWLEATASMTELEIEKSLQNQPLTLQQAYKSNDQSMLRTFYGIDEKVADKNTIFNWN